MSQQINLLDARFRAQKPHFSALTMALAMGAIAALAVVMQQLFAQQNRTLQATLAQADRRAEGLREQTVRLGRELGEQGRSTALAEDLVRIEEQLRQRRGLLEGMQGGTGRNLEGFSPYLSALARQTLNGVWLTGIEIDGRSGDLVLKGRVLDGDLVPAYLRRLDQEPLFKGRSVTELRLASKEEPGKRYVEFSLQMWRVKGAG